MTSITGLNLKQNCFAKLPFFDHVIPSIIDNFSNIFIITTNFDKNIDINMINIDSNKFYNHFPYFFILFNAWLFQYKKLVRLTKIKIT